MGVERSMLEICKTGNPDCQMSKQSLNTTFQVDNGPEKNQI